jgi:hypothetical protein
VQALGTAVGVSLLTSSPVSMTSGAPLDLCKAIVTAQVLFSDSKQEWMTRGPAAGKVLSQSSWLIRLVAATRRVGGA